MEVEQVVASEVLKEVVWLWKFLIGLGVIPLVISSLVLFCDNNEAVAQSIESRNHQKIKHIERKYYLKRDIALRENVVVEKIALRRN